MQTKKHIRSGFFITFSGNCEKALKLYQSCFGGDLHFDFFDKPMNGFEKTPVINGSLVSDRVIIYGSDLVHNEGRRVGNYISIYIPCDSNEDRFKFIQKLKCDLNHYSKLEYAEQILIEVVDSFNVRWIFGI